jgi:putative membrane protein
VVLAAAVARASFPSPHLHPDVLALVAVIECSYLWAVRRHGAGTTRRQVTLFSLGVLALWIASDYPIHDLAENYLYMAHMVQHMLFTLVAAPLLLLGTPAWMARRVLSPPALFKGVRWISRPVPGLIQFNLVLVLSHWPLIVDGTLEHHPLHFLAHTVLFVSALLMWMPVVSPLPEIPQAKPPTKMLYLFLQTIVPTVPASFLTFGTSPLYHFYEHVPRLYGISALSDMQMSGLIMKLAGGFFLWSVIGVIFFRWYGREQRDDGVLFWDDVEKELKQLH